LTIRTGRYVRFYDYPEDQRLPAQRDKDRVLYSDAFRRLAGITQVASPLEGHLFHTRLTHSLEVAQIARRIAEKLANEISDTPTNSIDRKHIDPDVVEAAALIHDLGHPPFGHIGEETLNELWELNTGFKEDGFEGNAQSFRIVGRLEPHRPGYPGLNLCRATLNAALKYPWLRSPDRNGKKHRKYGAYKTDNEMFCFARDDCVNGNQDTSLEAKILDYADDVAFSIHDLDDFSRVGLLPLPELYLDSDSFNEMIKDWEEDGTHKPEAEVTRYLSIEDNSKLIQSLLNAIHQTDYIGTFFQRASRKEQLSGLIRQFIFAVKTERNNGEYTLNIPIYEKAIIGCFKRILWKYLICNPALATQQEGQRRVVNDLFHFYIDIIDDEDKRKTLIPTKFHNELEGCSKGSSQDIKVRLAIDIVANYTDFQAMNLHSRIYGILPGAVSDIVTY